jgi:hypothetical protein
MKVEEASVFGREREPLETKRKRGGDQQMKVD